MVCSFHSKFEGKKETKLLTHNCVFDRCSTSSPFNYSLGDICSGSHLRKRIAATVHQFIAPMSMCTVPWAVWFLPGLDFLSCYPQVVSVGRFCKCIYWRKDYTFILYVQSKRISAVSKYRWWYSELFSLWDWIICTKKERTRIISL